MNIISNKRIHILYSYLILITRFNIIAQLQLHYKAIRNLTNKYKKYLNTNININYSTEGITRNQFIIIIIFSLPLKFYLYKCRRVFLSVLFFLFLSKAIHNNIIYILNFSRQRYCSFQLF